MPNKKEIKIIDIIKKPKVVRIESPGEQKASKIKIEAKKTPKFDLEKLAKSSKREKKEEKTEEVFEEKVEKFEKEEIEWFAEEERVKEKRKRVNRKYVAVFIVAMILLAGGIYAGIEFLPRVTIKIVTKKFDWNYIDSVIASSNATLKAGAPIQVPAEVFIQKKSFTFSFPTVAKKQQMEEKARGKITIYNNYGPKAQILIKDTRFQASDGKIFFLNQRVVVPAAKVVGSKIIPSSIEASVTAEKAGQAYNIGPVKRFVLPGFSGKSEKYNGFYAESKKAMTGGVIGEVVVPLETEIAKAKQKAENELKENIHSFLMLQIPKEFKVISGSDQLRILREDINGKTETPNTFNLFIEGEESIIAFKETDLTTALKELAKADLAQKNLTGNFALKDSRFDYGVGRADFNAQKISFALNFQGVFEEKLDIENLRQDVLGKSDSELQKLVAVLPNIQKVTIGFWPKLARTAPKDIKRITIEVE